MCPPALTTGRKGEADRNGRGDNQRRVSRGETGGAGLRSTGGRVEVGAGVRLLWWEAERAPRWPLSLRESLMGKHACKCGREGKGRGAAVPQVEQVGRIPRGAGLAWLCVSFSTVQAAGSSSEEVVGVDTGTRVGPMSSANSPVSGGLVDSRGARTPAGQEALWLEKGVMVGVGEVGECCHQSVSWKDWRWRSVNEMLKMEILRVMHQRQRL